MRKGEKSFCRQRESIKNENNNIYEAQVSGTFRDSAKIWSFECYTLKLCFTVTAFWQVFHLSIPFWWGYCGDDIRHIWWSSSCLLSPPSPEADRRPSSSSTVSLWDQEASHSCLLSAEQSLKSHFSVFDLNVWPYVLLMVAQFIKTSCFISEIQLLFSVE